METDSNSAIHKNPNPVSNTDEDDEFPDSRLKALSLNDPANVADGDLDLYEEASAEFVNGPFDSKPQIDEKLPSETALVEPTEVEKRDEIASNNIFADANYDKKDESLSRRENSSSVTDVAVAVLDALEVGEDVEAEERGEIASNNLSADANYDSKDELLSGEENSSSVTEMSVAAGGQEVDMGVGEISFSSGIIRGENSEVEFEDQASPSSSGYAGERGSTSASVTSEIEEVEDGNRNEIVAQESDVSVNGGSNSAAWVPGKRHVDEDDASLSWRKRKKHFFVLSHSGKPIYSRYGDEHKLAGFSATLQAIISFVENGGDRVKFVRAGNHQVIFLVKGPIYLVCISCTEEPQEALRGQLELIYGQMLLILTKSINRCFERNPKFDMTPLLGGTDAVFSSLIHSFSWNPATFLHAYTCLPLAYPTRQAAGAILQDVADSGVLFAILMCKHKVISLVGAQKASLHPDDMFLLANFVLSSESFRTSESFSPICLPRYNPMAFLYAYVHYLDVDTYLVLLTTSSDAFYHLKDCRIRIEMVLLKSNVLSEVQRSMLEGGLRVEDLPTDLSRSGSLSPHLGQNQLGNESLDRLKEPNLGVGGPAGLWHFMYRSINLDQYVSSEFSSPISSSSQQKRLYRGYQKLYASMHEKGTGPHKTQFRRDENYVLLCWITQDFELYAAFDPLADKALAIKICNQVCQWVRDVENEIFLLGSSPFSW